MRLALGGDVWVVHQLAALAHFAGAGEHDVAAQRQRLLLKAF